MLPLAPETALRDTLSLEERIRPKLNGRFFEPTRTLSSMKRLKSLSRPATLRRIKTPGLFGKPSQRIAQLVAQAQALS